MLPLLAGGEAVAHPVSHTDAWVRVSSAIDVRLNVFLDDVARHQGLPPDQELIPADRMQQAISDYSQTLIRQLQIFDESGRRLSGSVVSDPTWKPPADGVRMSADASLKLAWKLRYSFPGETEPASAGGLRSLTFLHTFTHESLPQPGELRLHLQDETSGRRIDAVVRPGRPHTMFLPASNDDGKTPAPSSEELSELVARLTVTRMAVVLEFTAPLILCDKALATLPKPAEQPEAPVQISTSQAMIVRQELADWFEDHVQVRLNGQLRIPESTTTVLLRITSEEIRSDGAGGENEFIPTMGTRAGIRMVWHRVGEPRSVNVTLTGVPGGFDSITAHVAGIGDSRTLVIPVVAASSNDSRSVAEFGWTSPSRSVTGATEFGNIDFNFIDRAGLWRDSGPGREATMAIASLALLAALIAGTLLIRGGMKARILYAAVLAVFGVPAVSMISSSPARSVDNASCQRLTQSLLDHVYRCMMLNDESESVDRLSRLLTPQAAEAVFLAARNSVGSDPADVPVVEIQSVRCEECTADPLTQDTGTDSIEVTCRWNVRGVVTHWGHTHVRNILLSGRISLSPDAERWKIAAVTLTSAPQIRDDSSPRAATATFGNGL
ncbi:MAG: hypothetical protein R3C19_16915 [Planctomycetaceae bacterium]